MNTRLVWNFEIAENSALDLSTIPAEEPEALRWEARYFWTENDIILLNGLPKELLDLTRYQIKQRYDHYYLLPENSYNIKQRRQELLYKPLLEETPSCQGFGKKINLLDPALQSSLPGLPPMILKDLLDLVNSISKKISVEKIALIHKFATQPTIKLELARLIIAEKVYFSVCIEGRSKKLVNLISNHLLKQQNSCDYVHFLKQI